MKLTDFPELTSAEIHQIEARARQLRGEYIQEGMVAAGRKIATLLRLPATLFFRRVA